jgi:hypothetical protein
MDYQGNPISSTYAYDLLKGTVMDKAVKVWLSHHHLEIIYLIA